MQKKHPKMNAEGIAVPSEARQTPPSRPNQLWVRPNMNLHHENRELGELTAANSGNTQKFLELANIALGLQKPANAGKKAKSVLARATLRKGKGPLQKN